MHRRKESLILRLLYQAVFGKEDLMHTLYPRAAPRPGRSGVDIDVVRSKAC